MAAAAAASQMLWLLATSALIGFANGATTINFALLWNEAGMANITQGLFNRIFLPNLTNACPAAIGVNGTQFNFLDLPHTRILDIKLVNSQITQLTSSNCLFAGANSQVSQLPLFTQGGVPSGVTGFPAMTVHTLAPLTLQMATSGIFKMLTAGMDLPAPYSVSFEQQLAIILGTGYSLEQAKEILDAYPGSVTIYWLQLGSESYIINTIKATNAMNFLLASSAEEADRFLTTAYDSLLLTSPYRWFLFNVVSPLATLNMRLVDKNDFAGFKVVSKNITSMEFGPISVAINYNLSRPKEIYAFDLLSIWSIYLRKIVCKEPGEVNQTFTGLTGDFELLPNGTVTRTDWRMYFYGGLGTERSRTGNWSYSTESFNFEKMPPRIANDATILSELKKNTFRVVTILKAPFVQYKKGAENDTTNFNVSLYDRLEGFAVDICKQILKNLTITDVAFFFQPDGQYGSQDSQGNWNGIVQTMMQGKADLACASISDTDVRRQVMQFTKPYLGFQLSILYVKRPENPLLYMFQFMRPFHWYTWLAVVGSVFALAIVLAVLHRLSRNSTVFSMYETIFFSFASLIQGITGTPPDRPSGQLVIAIYWLFAFVILVAYVTNYAANRTLSRLQSDITSLSTLYSQTTYNYGTISGTSYLTSLQNSTDVTQQQIFRYMNSDPVNRILPNLTVALNQVGNGTYALIYDSAMNQFYSQNMCFAYNTGAFSTQSASLGLPKSAEYNTMMNNALTAIIASGQRDRMYNSYFILPASERPVCKATVFPDLLRDYIPDDPPIFNTRSGALTLNNTLGIAVINIVGCVLTLLLATVEFVYMRCNRWLKRRRRRARQKEAESRENAPKIVDFDHMESTA